VPAPSRTTYHHGSLRDTLVQACVGIIESEGIGAVSLRRVAREAGVSPAAPYHHFADRSALLAAIAVRGADLLERELRIAVEQAPTGIRALVDAVQAYVHFARTHSGYVHVMLRPELYEPDKHPEAQRAGAAAIELLTDTVVRCQRERSAPPGDPNPMVGMIWALSVGIVTLWLDGPLEQRCVSLGTTPEQLTAQIGALIEISLSASAAVGSQGSGS
jgi:AcrR family transcriptional regulator